MTVGKRDQLTVRVYTAPPSPLPALGTLWVGPQGLMNGPNPVFNPPGIDSRLLVNVTDTTTNLTGTAPITTPIMGSIEKITSDYSISLATNEGRFNSAGDYEAFFSLDMHGGETSNAARNTISFWWELNGVEVSPRYQDNYNRDASGQQEVSQQGFFPFCDVSAGDVFRLRSQRIGGVGGIQTFGRINNATTTNSFLYIRRIA